MYNYSTVRISTSYKMLRILPKIAYTSKYICRDRSTFAKRFI